MECASLLRLVVLAVGMVAGTLVSPAQTSSTQQSLDKDWRFFRGDVIGAEQPAFDDSKWKRVDVPHDWSIDGPFDEKNPAGGAGAFLPSGVAWYRKHFTLPAEDLGQRIEMEFDGVMQDSDVWINGAHLSHHPYGYAGFQYELPVAALSFGGATNILTVCADTSAQPALRWYAGAGIFRHVRLRSVSPVHFAANGTFVSTPAVSAAEATAHFETTITNESLFPHQVSVETTLISADGDAVGFIESSEDLAPESNVKVNQDVAFPQPQMWTLDSPALYRAQSRLHVDGKLSGEQTTSFGVRQAHFDADTGFWLNGANLKIKDVCLHEDGGAFGMAVPLSIWKDRLATLKSLGVNAIRTAHSPPAPEFLDLCDRTGFLVMDEFFVAQEADPTRPVTEGLFRSEAGQGSNDVHWTGIDYLGESPGWPIIGRDTGLLDRTGAVRPVGRERQSCWTEAPMVAMARRVLKTGTMGSNPESDAEARQAQVLFPDWTPSNLKPHPENVEVYSNCKEVELFLNGRSIGSKKINADASPRSWQVSFRSGVLKAVARNDGRWPVATNELRTAGRATRIILSTETTELSTGWDNVAIVRARIADSKGVTVPHADDLVNFAVSGPGIIAAVDNGDNSSHEPFQATSRHAYRGECVAFVRANSNHGKIEVTATAIGLKRGTLAIQAAGEAQVSGQGN